MNIRDDLTAIANRLEKIEEVLSEYSTSARAAQERDKNNPQCVVAKIAFDDTSKREDKAEADRQYGTQEKIARYAFYAFLAAVFYAGISALQLSEMRNQTAQVFRQSDVENQDASKEAKRWLDQFEQLKQQAEALQRQATIGQMTMITSTRAYLALGQAQIFCPVCETGKIAPPARPSPYDNNASISVFFINSGHSPASNIDESFNLYGLPLSPNFAFPERPDVLKQPEHMMVQASTNFPMEITRGVRAEIILDARGQIGCGSNLSPPCPQPLYIYGHVSYTDVFHARHTLLYCIQYQAVSDVAPEHWNACPQHNGEYDGDYKEGRSAN